MRPYKQLYYQIPPQVSYPLFKKNQGSLLATSQCYILNNIGFVYTRTSSAHFLGEKHMKKNYLFLVLSITTPSVVGSFTGAFNSIKIALHMAVKKRNFKEVITLVDQDTPINAFDNNKQTPLHIAAQDYGTINGNDNLNIFLYLLCNGADPNRVDNWKLSPMHSIALCTMYPMSNKDAMALFAKAIALKQYNYNHNQKDIWQRTAYDLLKDCRTILPIQQDGQWLHQPLLDKMHYWQENKATQQ